MTMRRRDFIAVFGGWMIWPRGVHAQQSGRVPRIGVLIYGREAEFGSFVAAFRVGMAERGYQDAKNVRFEVHFADQDLERLAEIPIVFAIPSDPVASGFVRSLASPGTNMTGLSLMSSEMWAKRLELLLEVRADVRRLGVLAQPGEPASSAQLPHIQRAAAALGRELLVVGGEFGRRLSTGIGTP